MRTYDDIIAEINVAVSERNINALNELAAEVQKSGDQKLEAARLNALGSVLRRTGNLPAALECFHRTMAILEKLDDRGGQASVLRNIGLLSYDTGDFLKALEQYRRALAIEIELNNRANIALIMDNIGNAYFNLSDYPSALEYMRGALDIHEELGDRNSVARVTGNLGNIHSATLEYSQALELYQRSLSMYHEMGNTADAAMVTNNIGLVCYGQGDFPMALEYHQRALVLFEEHGDLPGTSRAIGNIVSDLLRMERFEEAALLLDRQSKMSLDDPSARASYEANRASIAEHKNDLETAGNHLLQALNVATAAQDRYTAAWCHGKLCALAQKRNDFAGFIEHNAEYHRITEEIRGKATTQKLALMEADRKMAKERAEHEKHLAVLHSTLPKHIADRVSRGEQVNDHYDNAAVIFLDIVDFTTISEQLTSDQVVQLLDQIFTALDAVCEKHDVVKIKTIGDSYMAVAFPAESSSSEQRAASAALDMLHAVSHIVSPECSPESSPESSPEGSPDGTPVRVRIGIHAGTLTAGVIGTTRLQYDVWGDTVNTASRLEATGEPGRIHISEAMAHALAPRVIPSVARNERGGAVGAGVRYRGETELKGKGTMTTYWLEPV